MEELIQQLVSKVGISQEQAQGSVGTVVEFIKGKLPENMHGILDGALGGEGADGAGGGIADIAKSALGGMFGDKK